MNEQFEKIYSQNLWLHGSGEGSLPNHTKPYRELLQSFLRQKRIRTVVDLGCGDWQFSRFINWNGIDYHGFDIVKSVIEDNQREFSSPNISFHMYSGNPADLPAADLLIAKDVFQHWSNRSIEAFFPHMEAYKYCLITNCVNPSGETLNRDIEDGDFRYLDLRLAPFGIRCRQLLSFTNEMPFFRRLFGKPRWRKIVLVVEKLPSLVSNSDGTDSKHKVVSDGGHHATGC